jgi:hypothetical protein
MQQPDADPDEIASVLIARLMREVRNFYENSLIPEGANADEIWSLFLTHLNHVSNT